MAFQDLFGEFVVFQAHAQQGGAVRVRDEGVKVIDVQFGLEQRGHHTVKCLLILWRSC